MPKEEALVVRSLQSQRVAQFFLSMHWPEVKRVWSKEMERKKKYVTKHTKNENDDVEYYEKNAPKSDLQSLDF
jgi:predicted transcriptional regulator YdeE